MVRKFIMTSHVRPWFFVKIHFRMEFLLTGLGAWNVHERQWQSLHQKWLYSRWWLFFIVFSLSLSLFRHSMSSRASSVFNFSISSSEANSRGVKKNQRNNTNGFFRYSQQMCLPCGFALFFYLWLFNFIFFFLFITSID